MKSLCKKYYVHVILVGLVAVVGGVAAFLYIDQFGANGFSNKSEDWANFATYISGTVGVAAVVATLIAFVITLRQQQKLIDSQDSQIELVKKQNLELKNKHRIELSYINVREVFPELNNAFIDWLSNNLTPYTAESSELRARFIGFFVNHQKTPGYLLERPDRLWSVIDGCPSCEAKIYLERFFKPLHVFYKFMCDQVEANEILYDYFNSCLWARDDNDNKKYPFLCYQAYLIGLGDEFFLRGSKLLKFEENYSYDENSIFARWQEIGRNLSK
ncbi:hypothetical protein [Halomonas sp. BL6]|uniref:hypothetical protein n=1 Tax=Halomonas sp. BL6 TaxID=2585770 RepID=UPI0011184373|nr:hypothetical protein [Halomonas sp. BL6]TNH20003.1 hypothetical protein FHJ80_02145 [Halomonas sp. BL6]